MCEAAGDAFMHYLYLDFKTAIHLGNKESEALMLVKTSVELLLLLLALGVIYAFLRGFGLVGDGIRIYKKHVVNTIHTLRT